MNVQLTTWEQTKFHSILEKLEAQYPEIISNITLNIDKKIENFELIVINIIDACASNPALCNTMLNISTPVIVHQEQPLEGEVTLLHLAAALGNLEVTERLVQCGVAIEKEAYRNYQKYTALDFAAFKGNIELMRFLIAKGAKGSFINMLCSAAYEANIEMMKFVLETHRFKNLDVLGHFLTEHSSRTEVFPINMAIERAFKWHHINRQDHIIDIECVVLLLRHGASCNPPRQKDVPGYETPLHIIAKYDPDALYHKFLLKLLIASGADRSVVNYEGETAEQINPSMTPIIDEAEKVFAQSAETWNFYTGEGDSDKKQIDYDLLREWYLLKADRRVCITMSHFFHPEKGAFKNCPPEISDQIRGYLVDYPFSEYQFPTREVTEIPSQEEDSITPNLRPK